MAAFQIRSAALFLLFTLLPQGSLTTQTTGKVYETLTIPARALDGLQILETIHNVTKLHCGVMCSQYEDRCNAMQLLDYKTRKGTCKLFHIDVHCIIAFNSTLSADELTTIYTSTDHSAKYQPMNQLQTSCAAIHTDDTDMASGVYTITPNNSARAVYCDMCTDGGGWTVIQRRQNGSLLFNRTWEEYEQGFGSADGELWIGNAAIHELTANQPCELRVDLWDFQGQHGYAIYSTFSVGDASTNYTLSVGGYSGNIGDSLEYHNSRPFSTTDRDNDATSSNCAADPTQGGGGGWWFRACRHSNLNGRYYTGGVSNGGGVRWYHWRSDNYSYKEAAMLTRPRK